MSLKCPEHSASTGMLNGQRISGQWSGYYYLFLQYEIMLVGKGDVTLAWKARAEVRVLCDARVLIAAEQFYNVLHKFTVS